MEVFVGCIIMSLALLLGGAWCMVEYSRYRGKVDLAIGVSALLTGLVLGSLTLWIRYGIFG